MHDTLSPEPRSTSGVVQESNVFVVVDAAQSFDMRLRLEGIASDHRCLLDGMERTDRAGILPYLVRLQRFGSATEWFRDEAFGRNWGILVSTTLSSEILVRDLKKFIRCDFMGDKNVFFRFYRPETFRALIRAVDARDLEPLFRGKAIYAEAPSGRRMTRFQMTGDRVETATFALDEVLDDQIFEPEI